MTATNCRRHHQGNCAGNLRDGICNRHRAMWDAMRADWQARHTAGEPTGTIPFPAFVFALPGNPDDWYTDCPTCHTTAGPVTQQQAQHIRDRHNTTGCETPGPATKQTPRPASQPRRPWTPDEDRILAENPNPDAIALLRGRTIFSISARRKVAGIPAPRQPHKAPEEWTQQEDLIIQNHNAEDAYHLLDRARTRAEIKTRREHFGITLATAWPPEEDAIVAAMLPRHAKKHLPHRTLQAINKRRSAVLRGVAAGKC